MICHEREVLLLALIRLFAVRKMQQGRYGRLDKGGDSLYKNEKHDFAILHNSIHVL